MNFRINEYLGNHQGQAPISDTHTQGQGQKLNKYKQDQKQHKCSFKETVSPKIEQTATQTNE